MQEKERVVEGKERKRENDKRVRERENCKHDERG